MQYEAILFFPKALRVLRSLRFSPFHVVIHPTLEILVKLIESINTILGDDVPTWNMSTPNMASNFERLEVVPRNGTGSNVRFLRIHKVLKQDVATTDAAARSFANKHASLSNRCSIDQRLRLECPLY